MTPGRGYDEHMSQFMSKQRTRIAERLTLLMARRRQRHEDATKPHMETRGLPQPWFKTGTDRQRRVDE